MLGAIRWERLRVEVRTEGDPLPWRRHEPTGPLPGEFAASPSGGSIELRWSAPSPEKTPIPFFRPRNEAALILERLDSGAVVARLQVETDQPLLREGGVRVVFGEIPGLRRFLACHLHKEWWTRPAFGTSVAAVPTRTQYLLWETPAGFGCLFPLVDGDFKAEALGDEEGLVVYVSSHDGGRRHLAGVAFSLSFDDDPYRCTQRAIEAGLAALGRPGRLRQEKRYPAPFEYLGWCTWDAFYHQVNAAGIQEKLEEFEQKGLPVRWMLVDDGWFTLNDDGLARFDPDPEKFPEGFRAFVSSVKARYGLDWVGLWHTITLHWQGISRRSPLAERYRENLLETKKGLLIPHPDPAKGFPLWSDFHEWARKEGFDFVKVDSQNIVPMLARDTLPAGRAARGAQHALQASAALHFQDAVINCMCMGTDAALHWLTTNVARSSDDFYPRRPESAVGHVVQNAYNALWYGHLAWCDFDMWYTRHPNSLLHAVLRAVSGGPLYVSDAVGATDAEALFPLILRDGRALRCDRPPTVARECLMVDPVKEPHPLKVWNAAGGTAVLAVFNVYEGKKTLSFDVRPEELSGEGPFAVYEPITRTQTLLGEGASYSGRIEHLGAHLAVIEPVRDGFALIGLKEKYLAPLTARLVAAAGKLRIVRVREGGTLLAYCEHRPLKVELDGDEKAFAWEDGWLEVKLPAGGLVTLQRA